MAFGQLHLLEVCDLAENLFTTVPAVLAECPALRRLELQENDLARLGPCAAALTGLTYLDLSENTRLVDLEPLAPLTALRSLAARGLSAVASLPDFVATGLVALRMLDIRGCGAVRELPQGLGSLPHLKKLKASLCLRPMWQLSWFVLCLSPTGWLGVGGRRWCAAA